jgi:hypothetical protein
MQRIFYFSGYRMKVFEWDGRRLLGAYEFEPDELGFAGFERFLDDSIPIPAKLLVDMIEEDFRRESIPHVNRWDRKALLERLIDRHYRDEDPVHATMLKRSSSGRRDDQVLLSALTNVAVLKPWLERIENHKVKLAGIWSLPLISKRLPKKLVLGAARNAVVVTRQIRGALRNTYFKNGQILLSRQARFDKSIWEDDTPQALVTHLQRCAGEIFNFLSNQRVLESGEHLDVHCLLPAASIDEARRLTDDSADIRYQFIELESLFKFYKLRDVEDCGADALFSYLCTLEPLLRDHYASNEQKSVFNRYLVDRVVTQTGELGTLLFVTAAVLLALNGMEISRAIKSLDYDTSVMAAEYNQAYGNVERELMSAETVRDSVQLSAKLFQETAQSPQGFFAPLSEVLGDPEFAALRLERLEWEKASKELTRQQLDAYASANDAEQNPYSAQFDAGYYYEEQAQEDTWGRSSMLRLRGRIDIAGLGYSATVERMRALTQRLQQMPEISEVMLIQTPVDVRGGASFSDTVGRGQSATRLVGEQDVFELLIVLEGVKHA